MTTTHKSLSSQMRERRDQVRAERDTIHAQMDAILKAVEKRGAKDLMASEHREFERLRRDKSRLDDEVNQCQDRYEELLEDEARGQRAAESRVLTGQTGAVSVREPGIYRRSGEFSFFKDLFNAQHRGDWAAAERLNRNNEAMLESRALGNTGATGGSGGEFAPPGWLVDEFVRLARPGRVFADLLHHEDLPPGVSTVNLPKVLTGTTTAIQSTQNSALSQTDMTTGSLSSGISTIGGKQVVSQQLLDQSPTAFDQVILGDLAADYAKQIDSQSLSGSGTSGQLKGYLTVSSGISSVAYTDASPTGIKLYQHLAQLQGMINAARYLPADAIVMHPRRWSWILAALDSNNRPLVVPNAGYNTIASMDDPAAQGAVGQMLGMNVYLDPNLPINLGAGTNQDVILMFRRDDVWLWESPLRAEAFREPYADTLGVLFRLFAYSAMIPDRYPAALGQVGGTGLVTPTYP